VCALIPFGIAFLCALVKRKQLLARNALIFICISTLLMGSAVIGYRYANKSFNGRFEFADRYDVLLFGNAYKRTIKLDADVWKAHFAAIPGRRFCQKLLSQSVCEYPEFVQADRFWPEVLPPYVS